MQLLYVTSDRSFWELARLTLHGEGTALKPLNWFHAVRSVSVTSFSIDADRRVKRSELNARNSAIAIIDGQNVEF